MVWNRIALVSLLLVVPSAGQCDEGTCHSLQPYFNCQVHFGSGAAGAGNTISFATCPVVGDIVIRVRLVGGAHSEKYVHALEVLQPYIDLDTVRLPGHFDRLHAEDRFVEAAFLSGLVSALRSRPIRPIHRKEDGHAEMLWREKIRWSMAWVFEIAGPAASCTYCFNDTEVMMHLPLCVRQPGDGVGQCRAVRRVPLPFELQVDVMPRARPLTAEIQEMTILELLVLLTGYIMDLQKMAALGFLHDNHLGNLLLVTSTDGERKMAWHDFGARSYFSSPTPLEIESFSRLLDESYTVVIASLERHSSTRGLVAKLNQTKSKWSLEGLDGVSSHLATLAERFQEVIMEWTEGSITMRRSLLQTWGRSIPPTRLEALRQLLEQGGPQLSFSQKLFGHVWADLFLSSPERERNPDWGQTNISECWSCSEARAVFLNPSDGPVSVGAISCFFHTGVFRFLRIAPVPCSVVPCLPVGAVGANPSESCLPLSFGFL